MPLLPKRDAKIIIRQRSCLAIRIMGPTVAEAIWKVIDPAKRDSLRICPNFPQNIIVVSTPCREDATRYVKDEANAVITQQRKVNVYEATPHSNCKGVIPAFASGPVPEVLDREIVNSEPARLEGQNNKEYAQRGCGLRWLQGSLTRSRTEVRL